MSLDPAELEAAVRRHDPAAVRDLLRDATEAQRAACAKALKAFLTGPEWHRPEMVMLAPRQFAEFLGSGFQRPPAAIVQQEQQQAELNREYDEWREVANGVAFQAAAFGLAGGVTVASRLAEDTSAYYYFSKSRRHTDPEADIDLIASVLADRRPAWLAEFVNRRLQRPGANWQLARTLVRLGAIGRPDVPEYTTLMPRGALRVLPGRDGRPTCQTPAEALLADPGLLEDEVWRLFAVPDAAAQLTEEWAQALAQLSADGHLDRDRLIDACLDAFTRDFNPNRVSWYATMLQQLDPSVGEVAARSAKYLGLLAATSKAGVKLGQEGAARLLDADLLVPAPFLAASAPALLFPQKSIAAAQLKLIGRLAGRYPDARPAAAVAAAAAFGHDRQDIQEAALALTKRLGVPDTPFPAEIRAHAMDLSPSLAADAAALGLTRRGPPPASQQPGSGAGDALAEEIAALERRIRELPGAAADELSQALVVTRSERVPGPAHVRPEAGAALSPPVTDPGELVQLLTVLIEDARDAVAAERALAGAVRLSGLPVALRTKLVAPLMKRARQIASIYSPFYGDLITSDFALITLAWGGEALRVSRRHREDGWHMPGAFAVSSSGQALTMAGIFSARAWEAAKVIQAGQGGVLLAEPETERGAITAGTLLDRVLERAAHPYRAAASHDQDVALLRLAPGNAGELWAAWAPLAGLAPDAMRQAHQLIQSPLAFEAVTGLPSGTPLRSRGASHEHLLARLAGVAPQVPACRSWQLLTGLPDPLGEHEVLYGPSRYQARHYDAAVAGWPMICPWQPEIAAAHLLRPLSDGLIPGLTPATTAILSMQHPGHPLGPVGHLGLVAGLASAEADTRIAAAGLWLDACADGRLDPAVAATAIETGVRGRALKLNRITDGLQHASHTALASRRIVETVCAYVGDPASAAPANLHLLVELAARLGATVGVPELPAAVRDLASRRGPRGSSRLVTTAAQLVRASEGAAPDRGQAAAQALTALIARADVATPAARAGLEAPDVSPTKVYT